MLEDSLLKSIQFEERFQSDRQMLCYLKGKRAINGRIT